MAHRDFERSVKGELSVLYRVARRLGASPEASEDIVQSTLIKAYQAWGRFDGRYVRSWLITILRNEWLMSLRSSKNDVSLDAPESPEVPDGPFWDNQHARMDVERILVELDRLPDIYKLAIQLCDVEQMTYEEAADAMEVPVGTVRSRLFRARVMLRSRMEGKLVEIEN